MNNHHWRALFRAVAVDSEGVWCVIPAWSSTCAICIKDIPFQVKVGDRFHGKVYLAAEDPKDLQPKEYEP
jgi:hypothetical protein